MDFLQLRRKIIGVPFVLDEEFESTNYSKNTIEGVHFVVASRSAVKDDVEYAFVRWEDGSTDLSREINLTSDRSLTIYYKHESPQVGIGIGNIPEVIIPIALITIAYGIIVWRRRKTESRIRESKE